MKINGRPARCPLCGHELPGWRREVLPDSQDRDRVIFTVECPCGYYGQLHEAVDDAKKVTRRR